MTTNSNIFPNTSSEIITGVVTGAGSNMILGLSPLISGLLTASFIILCDRVIYPVCVKIIDKLWNKEEKKEKSTSVDKEI